jgi:hypothetical protein
MTLEEACRAGSFTIEKVTVGLDGVRRSARRLGETIMVTRVSDFRAAMNRAGAQDPRLAAALRAQVAAFVRDPRAHLNRAAPAQIPTPRALPQVAVTDARLDLGIVEQDDPRFRSLFEALAVTQDMTWADLCRGQFQ